MSDPIERRRRRRRRGELRTKATSDERQRCYELVCRASFDWQKPGVWVALAEAVQCGYTIAQFERMDEQCSYRKECGRGEPHRCLGDLDHRGQHTFIVCAKCEAAQEGQS